MPNKKSKVKTVNSRKKWGNKPALSKLTKHPLDIKRLSKVMVYSASPRIADLMSDYNRKRIEDFESIFTKISVCKSLMEKYRRENIDGWLANIMFGPFVELEDLLLKERALIERLKKGKSSVGRPQVNGRMAFILFSALEACIGDRDKIDQIGALIKSDGDLERAIDCKYGSGHYKKLNMPTVSFNEHSRWDASVKQQLKKVAMGFIKKKMRLKKLSSAEFYKQVRGAYIDGMTLGESSEVAYYESFGN